MSTRVHILLPDVVVEEVDAVRGDVSRSKFVLRAVEQALVSGITPRAVAVAPATSNGADPRVKGRPNPMPIDPPNGHKLISI